MIKNINNMDKIAIVVLIILLIVGALWLLIYLGIINLSSLGINPSNNSEATATPDPAQRGLLPEIQTNALENKPNINPMNDTNPVENIKTNPFE